MLLKKRKRILVLISCLVTLAVTTSAQSQADLLPYTGVYRCGKANDVVISLRRMGTQRFLVLTDLRTAAFRALFPKDKDEFLIGKELTQPDPAEYRISFTRDSQGRVQSLELTEIATHYACAAEKLRLQVVPIEFERDSILFKGDLFLPAGPPPFPAVVLAHGSEENDRFSFDALPHLLAANGIAAIVYDKRGTGQSTGSWQDAGLKELAEDLLAAVALLKQRKDINEKQIGIIGFSEGGWIAPIAASSEPSIAFIVSISGGAFSKGHSFLYKYKQQFLEKGLAGEALEKAMAEKRAIVSTSAERVRENKSPSGFDLRITYDPASDWKNFQNPVLYLAGEYDVLEPVEESAARLKQMLSTSGNPDFTIKIFPQANHAMLLANSNKPSEFHTMKGVSQFVPGYWDTLLRWLQVRLFDD